MYFVPNTPTEFYSYGNHIGIDPNEASFGLGAYNPATCPPNAAYMYCNNNTPTCYTASAGNYSIKTNINYNHHSNYSPVDQAYLINQMNCGNEAFDYYYDDTQLFNDFNTKCAYTNNNEVVHAPGISNIYNNILYSPGPPIITTNPGLLNPASNTNANNSSMNSLSEQTPTTNQVTTVPTDGNACRVNSPHATGSGIVAISHMHKGPVGCNLFCFHLPNEITNW